MKPWQSSGNYQKKLDRAFDFASQRTGYYSLRIPGHPRSGSARDVMTIPMKLPHETLGSDLEDDPSILFKTDEMKRKGLLPPCYTENPVVKAGRGGTVVPLALYMDGVQYSNTDSCVGMWLVNLATQRRSLITATQKSPVQVRLQRKMLFCACHESSSVVA